jgi:transcription elongation factor Elf1
VVKLDKKLGLGHLSCKVCGQRFQTGINCKPQVTLVQIFHDIDCLITLDLSAAVDVYSDWVDACDAVAKDTANKYEERDTFGIRPNNRLYSPDDGGVGIPEQVGRSTED